MYMVVSRWKVNAGADDEVEARGRRVREALRAQPGVELLETFRSETGDIIAVHGYADENTYTRIIQDENGPFASALRESGLEKFTTWVSSDRGSTIHD